MILSYALTSLFYVLIIAGIYLCFASSFEALGGYILLKRRLHPKLKGKTPGLTEKLDNLVFLATGKEGKGRRLLGIQLCIFFFLLTFGCFSFNIVLAFVTALLSALLPAVSLVSKIKKMQSKSSKEGLSFASEILRQYRVQGKNIMSCLESTVQDTEEYPFCGKQCYLLLLRLRAAGSKRSVRESCDKFALSIGTVWSGNLAQLIEYAMEGTDVSEALEDIISELMKAKERQEESKRMNSEAWRMSAFLVPALYAASVWLSVKFLGIKPGEFLKNQFFTAPGLLLFFSCLLLFCFNNLVISFVTNKNTDI